MSVRRTASWSAAWPPTTFAHVGESESSKSAMNTFAPELSALIVILASAGPVISTRRSSRSAGALATCHSDSRTFAGLRQEIEALDRPRRARRARAAR